MIVDLSKVTGRWTMLSEKYWMVGWMQTIEMETEIPILLRLLLEFASRNVIANILLFTVTFLHVNLFFIHFLQYVGINH